MVALLLNWSLVFPLAEAAFLLGFGTLQLWRYYRFEPSRADASDSKFDGTPKQRLVGFCCIALGVILPTQQIFRW